MVGQCEIEGSLTRNIEISTEQTFTMYSVTCYLLKLKIINNIADIFPEYDFQSEFG